MKEPTLSPLSRQKRRHSLALTIFGLIAAFVWTVTFVIGAVFYYRETQFKAERLNAHMQGLADGALMRVASGESPEAVFEGLTETPVGTELRMTVLDSTGVVVYDSGGLSAGTPHGDRHEVVQAMLGQPAYTLSRRTQAPKASEGTYFYSAVSKGPWIVRMSIPHDSRLERELHGDTTFLLIALAASVVVSIIAFFAAAALVERVENRQPQPKDPDPRQLKNRLSESLAQELRGPLERIVQAVDAQPPRMTDVRAELGKLRGLVDDLSAVSRLSQEPEIATNKTQTDLRPMIDEVVHGVQSLPPERRMRVHTHLPAKIPINGDQKLLEAVFRHLVDNALAYSAGRDIYINLDGDDGEQYTFTVADNGIGIPVEDRQRVFDRLFRLQDSLIASAHPGTGMGLSMVKNAVEAHGGHIMVDERPGGGARFTLTLKHNS